MRRKRLPAVAAAAALLVTLLATAWLCDDAYFTLRTVDNALAGHGLRWNAFERVQAYTHPAWMLVLLGALGATGEHYLTTIGVSLAISLAACAVLLSACTPSMRLPVLALLLLSRAFVDYSTGGLENPLSHLIAALFLRRLVRGDPHELLVPALLAALAGLTRLDSLLVYAPVIALRTWRSLRRTGAPRTAGVLALASVPVLAWELFAFVYYGSLVPNTAYAKLGTGLSSAELLPRGLAYLLDSLRRDPVSLTTVALACALALRRIRSDAGLLALGVVLYVAYVVRIGGDFMSGRLIALPLFVAAGLLGRHALPERRVLAWAPALALLIGAKLHRFDLLFVKPSGAGVMEDGIADERVTYWTRTGMLRPNARFQPEPPIAQPRKYDPGEVLWGWSGMQGFHAGRETIVVERYGLADPLLARLPARFDPHWRVGHYERVPPLGYAKRLVTGDSSALEDADLARYDALLRRVTTGPVWSPERLRIALELALGRHDHLIDREFYRYPLLRECELVEEAPGRWSQDGCVGPLAQEGARLTSDEPLSVSAIEVRAEGGAISSVQLLLGDEVVERFELDGAPPPDGRYSFDCPETPITGVWIQPEPTAEHKDEAMRLLDVTLVAEPADADDDRGS